MSLSINKLKEMIISSLNEVNRNISKFESVLYIDNKIPLYEINISTKFTEHLVMEGYKHSLSELSIKPEWKKRIISNDQDRIVKYFYQKASNNKFGIHKIDTFSTIDNKCYFFEFKLGKKIKEKEIIDIIRTIDMMYINKIYESYFILINKEKINDEKLLNINLINDKIETYEINFEYNELTNNIYELAEKVKSKINKLKLKENQCFWIMKLSINYSSKIDESITFEIHDKIDILKQYLISVENDIWKDFYQNNDYFKRSNNLKSKINKLFPKLDIEELLKKFEMQDLTKSLGTNVLESLARTNLSNGNIELFLNYLKDINDKNCIDTSFFLKDKGKILDDEIKKFREQIWKKNKEYPVFDLILFFLGEKMEYKEMNIYKWSKAFNKYYEENNKNNDNNFLKINTKRTFFLNYFLNYYCNLNKKTLNKKDNENKQKEEKKFLELESKILNNLNEYENEYENKGIQSLTNATSSDWKKIYSIFELFFSMIIFVLSNEKNKSLISRRERKIFWFIEKIKDYFSSIEEDEKRNIIKEITSRDETSKISKKNDEELEKLLKDIFNLNDEKIDDFNYEIFNLIIRNILFVDK